MWQLQYGKVFEKFIVAMPVPYQSSDDCESIDGNESATKERQGSMANV